VPNIKRNDSTGVDFGGVRHEKCMSDYKKRNDSTGVDLRGSVMTASYPIIILDRFLRLERALESL